MRFSHLPVWLRAALVAAAALFILATPTTLHASVIYDFTLAPDAGNPYGGSGTMTLNAAPPASGLSGSYTYADHGLIDLSFTIDGQTFDLFDSTTTRNGALVQFLNGSIYDITFADTLGTAPFRFTLDTTSGYSFYYNDGQSASYGTFTALQAAGDPAPTPEPGSIALLGTGLLAGAGSLYRRLIGRS